MDGCYLERGLDPVAAALEGVEGGGYAAAGFAGEQSGKVNVESGLIGAGYGSYEPVLMIGWGGY